MAQHICGTCQDKFGTEDQYLSHTCSDGFTPQQPEHLGPEFLEVQRAALERGKERVVEEGDKTQVAKQDEAIQAVQVTIDATPTPTVQTEDRQPPIYQA